jgi:hypothetical protein
MSRDRIAPTAIPIHPTAEEMRDIERQPPTGYDAADAARDAHKGQLRGLAAIQIVDTDAHISTDQGRST